MAASVPSPPNHHEGGGRDSTATKTLILEAEGHTWFPSKKADPPVEGGHYWLASNCVAKCLLLLRLPLALCTMIH